MKQIDFRKEYDELLTPSIVAKISRIHRLQGFLEGFSSAKKSLSHLIDTAKIKSIEASNRMDGIRVSSERIKKLVHDKTWAETQAEEDIAGYRDVLIQIHKNYPYIHLREPDIYRLQQDLFKWKSMKEGCSYRSSAERVQLEKLCGAFEEAIANNLLDPLILTSAFVLNYLILQPFCGGNERMSRILLLLMLYRSGFEVGKYISLERQMEDTSETYHEAVQEGQIRRSIGKK